MNLDYDVYKKSIGPKDLYHLMHFCLSSVMPVQASQSVIEPEGLYQNIIGFSDFLLGSAAVIGASAFDPFSQLHRPDQIGFTMNLLRDVSIRHTDTVRFVSIASTEGWQCVHFRQYLCAMVALYTLTGIEAFQKIKLIHHRHLIPFLQGIGEA